MLFMVELFPLLVSLFILAVVVLWFSIQNYKNASLLAIIIPLTLAATIISYLSVQSILGYPIVKDIEKDSIYISHITSADDEFIFVWVIEPGSLKPRALTIPNSDNNKKQMSDAKEKTQAGLKQKLAPHPNEKKLIEQGRGQTEGGEYMVYDFQIGGGSLKDYGNGQLGLPNRDVEDPNQENPGLFPEGGEFDTVPSSPSTNIPYGLNPEYGETPDGTVDYQDLPSLIEPETESSSSQNAPPVAP